MAEQSLSADDVKRLLQDPSVSNRTMTAEKLAQQFDEDALGPKERRLAEDIFRLLAKDVEVQVREALSANLKDNPFVPHDIAVTLAGDVDAVSLPMIEFSKVLDDKDLIDIVRSQGESKQSAVARREDVSEAVSEAIVDVGDEDVVATLVENKGAQITDASFEKVVDKYGDSERVQRPLVGRPRLPVTVAEKLVTRVSESLREHLVARHELPPDVAADLILQSREKATITLSRESSEAEVERLIGQLAQYGRLTPSIILRALCMGDLKFFEYALARQSGIPVVNARMLVHDSGQLGFQGIYRKAGLPDKFFPAMRAAVAVAGETDYDGRENDRARYSRRMIERILTQYGDLGVVFENDDLDYLMSKMNQLPGDITNRVA